MARFKLTCPPPIIQLGVAKVKNLEKRPPFPQFSSKLSDFFLEKDLSLQAQSF